MHMPTILPLYPQVIASWDPLPHELSGSERLIGGKAIGLLRLPPEWVPRFIVLTAAFYEVTRRQGHARRGLELLPSPDRELFANFMQMMLSQGAPRHILVRSNAPNEDLSIRGAFSSIAAEPTIAESSRAIDQVFGSAHPEPMCVILQEAVEPGVLGHMSNERRVSQTRKRWPVEGLGTRGTDPWGIVIGVGRTTSARPLNARTEKEVSKCLRTVARYLRGQEPGYFHCEWVWDSRRLWIVQCDKASPMPQGGDVDEYLRAKSRPLPSFPSRPNVLHFTAETTARWRKLERPKIFESLRMPVADVFVVGGERWCTTESRRHVYG